VNELWPSIEIIFEQEDLLQWSQEAVAEIKEDLNHKLGDATRIIKVLNSNRKYELKELKIEDRTEVVLEVRKVLTKRNLMLQLENKWPEF